LLDLVLIVRDAIPIYYYTNNKDLNENSTTDLISALRSFAQGSLKTELSSMRLGDLNIRLHEINDILYAFGTHIDNVNPPSDEQITLLVNEFESEWNSKFKDANITLSDKSFLRELNFDDYLKKIEEVSLIQPNDFTALGANETNSAITRWDLLPKKTQKAVINILESVILGESITILDNDPSSMLTQEIVSIFRIPVDKLSNSPFTNYFQPVKISGNEHVGGILVNPRTGELRGKYQKNKFLQKFLEKDVLMNSVIEERIILINKLIITIGKATKEILDKEKEFNIEKGNIQNLLQDLGFEQARLVLELIKKNKRGYYEKILELPIYKEWFSQW
jgi:hypothetical protein